MQGVCGRITFLSSRVGSVLSGSLMDEVKLSKCMGSTYRAFQTSNNTQSEERDLSYESAIRSLNALQSNAATLQKIRKERQKHVHLNLPQTRLYLERSGVTTDMLNSLKIIHVSGTKGKGSTCAFCESILRQYGLRTGFYSSPHLVSATERVRLDGEPVARTKFTQYFWQVYDKVCRNRSSEDRPPYFQFLTVLAFNIFIKEKVDVAIIEVGIGGEYDCTNVIEKPIVTGITALGLDHTNILGNTIAEIAWHKAGIMKSGVPTFIDGNQPSDALKVISRRSTELGASSLAVAPPLDQFTWGRFPQVLGLHGQIQHRNAALALCLANAFLAHTNLLEGDPHNLPEDSSPQISRQASRDVYQNVPVVEPFMITGKMALGLRLTDWPGRTQILDMGRTQYFLDGAHTEESVRACAAWFKKASKQSARDEEKIFKVMIFNTSGERDPKVLLTPFLKCQLDLVIFTTNVSGLEDAVDQQNFTTTDKIQLERCKSHLRLWTKLGSDGGDRPVTGHDRAEEEDLNSNLNLLATGNPVPGVIIPLICDALQWIKQDSHLQTGDLNCVDDVNKPVDMNDADRLQVLVTGSLHLVGGVLACIQDEEGLIQAREVDPELINHYKHLEKSQSCNANSNANAAAKNSNANAKYQSVPGML